MALVPFAICADSHGDMADKSATKAFLKFLDEFNPKIRVHLGDAIDFRAIRRGVSSEEKYESMQADYDEGTRFLRDMGATVWLWGNHEDRIDQIAHSTNGVMRDYAARISSDMKDFGKAQKCRILPYCSSQGVYELGKVKAGGFRLVHGSSSGVHALRSEVAAYGRVIHGHIHTRGTLRLGTYDPSEGHTCACLCRLDMRYSKAHKLALRQEHGWMYGVVNDRTGAVMVQHAYKVDDKFVYASEFGKI